MNVGLLLLTHNDIGSQLLLAAKSTYGSVPMRTELLSIDHYDKPAAVSYTHLTLPTIYSV